MFRSDNKVEFNSTPALEKNTSSMFIPVEQYDVKSFNLNDAGWPRNDIAQMARAQTYAEFQAIAARLEMLTHESNLPQDCTLEEAYNLIKPAWCQTASELSEFCEYTNTKEFSRLQKKFSSIDDGSKSPESAKSSVSAKSPEPSSAGVSS